MFIWLCLVFVAVAFGVSGCSGDVGASHRIDSGVDPKHQDRNVRFRTTYYFRVFDICDVLDEERRSVDYSTVGRTFTKRTKDTYKILNDSLYRFRMTGKASAMSQDVIFESGTLRAEQIDPFGSSIDVDEATRKFQVRSASENRELQKRNNVYTEVEHLYSLRKTAGQEDHQDAVAKIESLVLEQLQDLGKGGIAQSVSAAVMATTARESVLRTVNRLSVEPIVSEAIELGELKDAAKSLDARPEEDPLLRSAADMKANLETLTTSFSKIHTVIEKALAEQMKRQKTEEETAKAEGGLTKQEKAKAGSSTDASKAPSKEEVADEESASPFGEDREEPKLVNSQSNVTDEKRKKLESIQEILVTLSESKEQVEKDISKLKRASGMLNLSVGVSKAATDLPVSKKSAPGCADGKPSRRGFQVLGPEGFRSFDQDERLVLAMSVNSKPLINMLQQFSDQRFKAETSDVEPAEAVGKLEQDRLASALKTLADLPEDRTTSVSEILRKVLNAFAAKQGSAKPKPVSAASTLKTITSELQQ